MSTPRGPTHDDGATALAEGFAQHIEGWAEAIAAPDAADANSVRLVRRAAFELSLATGNGHVCLRLADLRDTLRAEVDSAQATIDLQAIRSRLLASGVVGTPERPLAMPLLLDADDRLYLHRYFDYEQRLARRLLRAAQTTPAADASVARELAREQLHALFGRGHIQGPVDWQKIAVALALRQRLLVVSGGPGTGKTSTVMNLLACLIAQNPSLRIALAAPTGKAAARLGEAIAQRAVQLPEALREKMPVVSHTVHRLLGAYPGGFAHDAENPLAIDVLVVDEASMLDLALATRLFEAVPDAARIVLLGDKDQLAAVESGAVFAELSADPTLSAACTDALAEVCGVEASRIAPGIALEPSPLRDSVVWFTHNYRFGADSPIARAADDIRHGRAAELIAGLSSDADGAVRWLDDAGDMDDTGNAGNANSALDATALQCMADGYAPYVDAVQRDPSDVAAVSRAFERFRVLCALRTGPRGVLAVNEHLSRFVRARLAPPRGALAGAALADEALSPWYIGRAVMVLRNDPLLKLFNGDIGIVLPAPGGGAMVHFSDGTGGHRTLPPLRLPQHETAFAMTVHKAQGSEFDELLLLLPQQRSRVLTRELLYTALTRARSRVVLAAGRAVLQAAVETPTRRHSGLLARLRDEAMLVPPSPPGPDSA